MTTVSRTCTISNDNTHYTHKLWYTKQWKCSKQRRNEGRIILDKNQIQAEGRNSFDVMQKKKTKNKMKMK